MGGPGKLICSAKTKGSAMYESLKPPFCYIDNPQAGVLAKLRKEYLPPDVSRKGLAKSKLIWGKKTKLQACI